MNPIGSQTIELLPVLVEQKAVSPEQGKTSTPVLEPISSIEKEETDMPEEPVLSMTRKQLYDEIWEISVAGLARKYDIPYSQLMKQIKEAAIPIPSSGYWTLLNLGKPTTKIELPEPADAIISICKTVPRTRTKKKKVESPHRKVVKEEMKLTKNEPVLTAPAADSLIKERAASLTSNTTASTVIEKPVVPVAQAVNEPETYTQFGKTYNVYDNQGDGATGLLADKQSEFCCQWGNSMAFFLGVQGRG